MSLRVAMNGFGRIGRQCLRFALQSKKIKMVAINELSSFQTLAHLFKYDSVHSKYPGTVTVKDQCLNVDGHDIALFSEGDIKNLFWKDLNVDLVLECTGKFASKDLAQTHLKRGAKRVLVSAPCQNADFTVVMGVNENDFEPKKHHVISNASCTTNCLAVVVKILRDSLGIQKASMTTVHSYTSDQRILDNAHRDLRRARAAALSMIPTTSGATAALVKIFPELSGSFEGLSVRVPTPNVSLLDLVAEVKKKVTASEVNQIFKEASQGKLKKYLGYTVEPLVSVDYIGDPRSAVIDASLTQVIGGRWVKVIAWYDNEAAFSRRMIDFAEYMI